MKVICDSGAYSIFMLRQKNKKDLPDEETFFQSYVSFIKENSDLEGFINLDVIFNGEESLTNFIRLRQDVPKNIRIIPVYHNSTPIDLLHKYLNETDHGNYISVGAVAGLDMRSQVMNLRHVFDVFQKHPEVKVHGLGVTSVSMSVFPWYSVDSTSWVQFSRYGVVLVPRLTSKGFKFTKSPISLHVTNSERKVPSGDKHLQALSQFEQDTIKDYFENYLGVPMGKSKMVDGKEVIEEPGVCNNNMERDFVNGCYYMEMAKNLGIRMYLGGNFPQMLDPDRENEVANRMFKLYGQYNRFASFFYQEGANNVINVARKRGNENESGLKRIGKSIGRTETRSLW